MGMFIVEHNLLSKSPTTVEEGDIIVDRGYTTITVRNVEADSAEIAEEEAKPRAQAFLNELCWRYGIVLELGNGSAIAPQEDSTTRHLQGYRIKVSLKGGASAEIPQSLGASTIKTVRC